MEQGVTADDLATAFRMAGLGAGDNVVVHSALGSVGFIEGGADAVLDSLLEVISPGGTLVLPTFNYSTSQPHPCFEPHSTPCLTGLLAETGRKHPKARRSLHPTHSVAAIGPLAEEIIRDHLAGRAFGADSPLDRLARRHRGKVLLLGVNHTANSTIHVAEEHAGTPKGGAHDQTENIRLADGRVIEHRLDSSPSCSVGFGAAEFALRRHRLIRDSRVGRAKLQAMAGADVIREVVDLLGQDPEILLCTSPSCRSCARVRENLRG